MNPSMSGSFFAREVLKMMQNATTAITRRVPCHLWGMYVLSLRTIKPWMIVPARKESPTTDPCHPVARSQPWSCVNKIEDNN